MLLEKTFKITMIKEAPEVKTRLLVTPSIVFVNHEDFTLVKLSSC